MVLIGKENGLSFTPGFYICLCICIIVYMYMYIQMRCDDRSILYGWPLAVD